MTGYTCLHRYPPTPSLTMPTKRTYSGGRIRITERQAAIIEHLVTEALKQPIRPEITPFTYELRDLRNKVEPHVNRADSTVHRLRTTPAGVGHTHREHVGHNAGTPGHTTGRNGSTAVTAARPAGPGSSLDTSEIT